MRTNHTDQQTAARARATSPKVQLRMLTLVAVAVSCFAAVQPAFADFNCTGPVRAVSIEATTGDLLVGAIGPLRWARLCSVNQTVGSITPAACKSVHSTLLIAQSTGQVAHVSTRNTPTPSCEAHPEWQWVQGFYFVRLGE
ncbi:UNVERIFIED_ORG: hypothetical protein LHJ69_23515 [Shinella sp. XGS7]|nr:hypothetical protein [Shinella sp. XGS7]